VRISGILDKYCCEAERLGRLAKILARKYKTDAPSFDMVNQAAVMEINEL
jgi:hypothetical protein